MDDRERRGGDEADDDLEKFFAPLEDDWAEEEEPLLPEAPSEGEAEPVDEGGAAEPSELDEWSVQIDLPEEGELLPSEAAAAEEPTEPEAEEPPAEAAEEEGEP